MARHAYGDIYRNAEMKVEAGDVAELVVTAADGTERRERMHNFDGQASSKAYTTLTSPLKPLPELALIMV